MSTVWLKARAASGGVDEGGGGGGGGGGSGGSNTRRRERGSAFWGSVATAGGSGNSGVTPAMLNAPDEFQRSPRLRFQLLLREQGVIVTLFDAMETVGPRGSLPGEVDTGVSQWMVDASLGELGEVQACVGLLLLAGYCSFGFDMSIGTNWLDLRRILKDFFG